MSYTIVGVIGHIDHGKTSLVAALTGTDTDTHPEEKRRGITIDLGFASFTHEEHQFALIDAPGHQKYIGNLLAGVSGIDIGLLVVACDQGIQEQTLEHASILQLLGVNRLVTVLSRIDLASEETQEELREELELFLDDRGFTDVPMVPVSSVKKTGLDDLKTLLAKFADELPSKNVGDFFRMPVDRVFTMPGRGCVIAGTVWSGEINTGDNLELADSGTSVRVREVEVHGETVDASRIGRRTALNVAGISANEVQRGDDLIQPDVFPRSSLLLVELQTFRDAPELKCPATMQMHAAASSRSARITGVRRLKPSQSAVVIVETDQPVVATFGQNVLFRLPYPVGTVGGGKVLAALPQGTKKSRKLVEFGEKIAMSDASERLCAWTEFFGELQPTPPWLALQAGIGSGDIATVTQTAVDTGIVSRITNSDRLVAAKTFELIRRKATELLTQNAEDSQDAWSVLESVVRLLRDLGSESLIRLCINSLITDGEVVRVGERIAIASDENSLSKKQQKRMEQIVTAFADTRSPPSLKEVAERLQLPLDVVRSLSRFAVQTGMLIDTGHDLLVSAEVLRELCAELSELFADGKAQTVADIRDRWQVTRKHAIPFLEFCDRNKITVRNENMRSAGQELQSWTRGGT